MSFCGLICYILYILVSYHLNHWLFDRIYMYIEGIMATWMNAVRTANVS